MQLDHAQESYALNAGVSGSLSDGNVPTYPNGPNNGLFLSRKLLVERGVALRGVSRGLLVTAQNCHLHRAKIFAQENAQNNVVLLIALILLV